MLKKIISFLIAAPLVFSLASCGKNASEKPVDEDSQIEKYTTVKLVENGRTEYKIVVSENATETEMFAAEELQNFFSECIDERIQIVTDEFLNANFSGKYLSVGDTKFYEASGMTLDRKELNTDGFKILTKGNTVVMNAAGENGKIYSVYEFMERNLGVVFYGHDEIKTPDTENAYLIDFDLTEIPDFISRSVHNMEFFYNNYPNFSQRMRVNDPRTVYRTNQGEGTQWSSLWAHEQLNILPFEEYGDEHYEWFTDRFYEGETFESVTGTSRGICWTSEEVMDQFAENLITRYIEKQPNKTFFSIAQSDGHKPCKCEECLASNEKYTLSGTMVRFNNEIAKRVKAWIDENCPDRIVYLASFAYLDTLAAPVKRDQNGQIVLDKQGKAIPLDESLYCDDMVMMRFAPLRNCYTHDFMDQECNEQCGQWVQDSYSTYDSIVGWSSICETMSIWNYIMPFGNFFMPFNDFSVVQRNYRTLKEHGFIDVLEQGGNTEGTPFIELRTYVKSKLMWNVDLSYEELVDDFFVNFYKDAAPEMREYYDLVRIHFEILEKESDDFSAGSHQIPSAGYSGQIVDRKYFSIDVLEKFKAAIDKALAKANTIQDPELRQKVYDRVNKESLTYRYLQLELYSTHYSQFENPSISDLVEEMEDLCGKIKFTYYAEHEPMSEKIAEWKAKSR